MHRIIPFLTTGLNILICALAQAGERHEDKGKLIEEPAVETWELKIAVPSWIAAVRGDLGLNGTTVHSNTGFNEVVNKLNLVGALRGELGIGRFGMLADFSYLSLSDSIGVDRALRKVDFRQDQMLGDFGLRWRVIDTPRGWLDVLGGTRYTYLNCVPLR